MIPWSKVVLTAGTANVTENPIDWETAWTKAEAFVAKLTLQEKIGTVTGTYGLLTNGCVGSTLPIPRIGFPGLCLQDGPAAMNHADLITIFPSGVTTAASWDKDLIYRRGRALGAEFRGKGAHVFLGPVAGPLGRHPLGGRNWEGFSPDPYLTGVAMSLTIRGVQAEGVQASAKHYLGNEQETQRSNSFLANGTEILGISSNIDDRTLHELYLWPFAEAVKAGVLSIMCSYNRLNQTYACENDHILGKVLRQELGFRGYVVSDWLAVHSGPESINAGLDMNMPGAYDLASYYSGESWWGGNMTKYIDAGNVSETRIDEMVKRIMTPYYLLGQDTPDFPTTDPSFLRTYAAYFNLPTPPDSPEARDVRKDHASLVRRLGAESVVLLKNVNSTLPLRRPKTIGVFGNDAVQSIEGPRYRASAFEIGTVDIGGGSGSGQHVYLVSPLEAIQARATQLGSRVQHIIHNKALAADRFEGFWPIPEVCLIFLGTYASEGTDRTSFEPDWNSTLVVERVSRRCSETVVILHSAGVNTLPWADNPNVTAILAAHLPGQESGNSIVDILWGDINPSGRLPYTIPVRDEDYHIPITNLTEVEITSPSAWQANFSERQLIDYRHFDHYGITPLFEFGFGLSYTTFELNEPLHIEQVASSLTARPDLTREISPGGNPTLWDEVARIRTRITNTGTRPGAVVVQLYVAFPSGTVPEGTPLKVLRGFEKLTLCPGESSDVVLGLNRRDVSYWDTMLQDWVIPLGKTEFQVGFSSRDIRQVGKYALRVDHQLEGDKVGGQGHQIRLRDPAK